MNRTAVQKFLNTERTPRWQIIAGGALVVLIGFGQNAYFYSKAVDDAQVAEQQSRIHDKLLEIQQHSIDFQTYANAFVASVLDNTDDLADRRQTLIDNILSQDAAVDVARDVLDASVQQEVANYRKALREMKASVESVSDVISMSRFWQSASDLLVARNKLLDSLSALEKLTGI